MAFEMTGTGNRANGGGRIITGPSRRAMMVSLLWLFPLCLRVAAAQGKPTCDLPRVAPGLEYIHHRTGEVPWSVHAVKVDRSRRRLRLASALAETHVYGLATVSDQVGRLCETAGRPVAAVNGDFFHIRPGPYQGDPMGLHIVGGELVSSPVGASFWIDKDGQPHIGPVRSRFRARGPAGLNIPFGLNQERAEDTAVLYTPAVGASTRTSGGVELVLARQADGRWLPLRAGASYHTRVAAVHEQGDTGLTPENMVLSIGPVLAREVSPLATGMEIALSLSTSPDLVDVTLALGGGPVLLDGGTSPQWSPPLPRHPRTAIGWNEEHLFLVVVDGRQEGLSAGMTYPELSSLMRRLGCTHAMNLDGGGSSTLWLDGHIMNAPSDGHERRVANSLIVVSGEPDENERNGPEP